tara:strand:- start:155 stop:400 length:246 start_codon:yes stop_codon:yes gene_type:complete
MTALNSIIRFSEQRIFIMANFKIDGVEYDTEKLDTKQKRVIALYQQSVKDEAEAVAKLELSRAARVEIGKKLKELVIDKKQ